MTVRQLTQMTWRELRTAAPGSIALIPVGSQEQHGEHLPLGTDQMLADTVVDEAVDLLEQSGPDLVRLPTVAYGLSPHHAFAAAITLSSATLLDLLSEILDSLADTGFRRMVVVNGHGGNDEVVRLAVKQAALRADIAAAACNYWNVTGPADENGDGAAESGASDGDDGCDNSVEDPARTPGHAGWFETALMLAAHPDLVHAADWEDDDGDPPLFDRPPYPGLVVERHGEWSRVHGVTDDPSAASTATGRTLLTRRVQGLATAITEFHHATNHSHGSADAAG